MYNYAMLAARRAVLVRAYLRYWGGDQRVSASTLRFYAQRYKVAVAIYDAKESALMWQEKHGTQFVVVKGLSS